MLAWPYLILKGWLPYRDIAIAHNPLLLVVLTGFYKLFGIGITQLKVFTWGLIGLNAYLTYFVAKKLLNNKIGIFSALLYVVFSIVFQGNGLWFDLALTPFVLLLYFFVKENKYLYAGIVFALGFLTKQTFIYFFVPVVVYIFQKKSGLWSNLRHFFYGNIIVVTVFLLVLSGFRILDDYYNWAIKFGILYLPQATGQVVLPSLKQLSFALVPFLIFLFNLELLPWAIMGILGTYPRWELFHLQPGLPFLAIALTAFVFSKRKLFLRLGVLAVAILYMVYGLGKQVGTNTRFFESDVKNVSTEILEKEYKNIYVVNYWDNIYAFTNTTPVTKPLVPYIPWYLDFNNYKERILTDVKANSPDAIVIGERDSIFPKLYEYIDKFYDCKIIEKKVELCEKNKI
jgi:hypothetical protein